MTSNEPDPSETGGVDWVHERSTSKSLGDGFVDHGAVGFRTYSRGWVGTDDGESDVVLVWLRDANAGWLGMIDVDTGAIEEYSPSGRSMNDPFASLLSSRNRYYACNHHFVEFDPTRREFTFVHEDVDDEDALGMSMTEDDDGVIWAAAYPNATVVSYDPATETYRDYGHIYEHPSTMYPRSIAADDRGWIYVALRPAAGQLLILDRDTGEATPVLADDETVSDGDVSVTRDVNGVVYGRAGNRWFECHDGVASELESAPTIDERPIVTGTQRLAHSTLPSGRRITELDLGREVPTLTVTDPNGDETTTVSFDPSGGDATPMGLTSAPDGSIVGGSFLPVQLFRYVPDTDEWSKTNNFGQWNTIAATAECVYAGHYPAGALLRWDLTAPWNPPPEREDEHADEQLLDRNPAVLASDWDHLHRPFTLLVHPGGRYVIMGGQPDYGHAGGGLLFWDRHEETAETLTHEDVLRWHITRSLVALPDGRVVGGTDVRPAGGGVRKADVAALYMLDVETRDVIWSETPIGDVERYQDMVVTPSGTVVGVADRDRLFAFDPDERAVVHERTLAEPTVDHQGPRIFVQAPDDRFFVLFASGTIAELDPETFELTTRGAAPTGIQNGGTYLDGRLYFATATNVYSWAVPPTR